MPQSKMFIGYRRAHEIVRVREGVCRAMQMREEKVIVKLSIADPRHSQRVGIEARPGEDTVPIDFGSLEIQSNFCSPF